MNDKIRKLDIICDFTNSAAGSVLISTGNTRVICTASVTNDVPPFRRGKGGWLTAEYAMLPGSTSTRKARDGIKKDGRGVEIQRLIGRALRAACDLTRLGEHTIYIDCDVIQADGGTRTASITGSFVALCLAVDKLLKSGEIVDSPIVKQIAAVSVGKVKGECTLDLCYIEDSNADVDMNVIMAKDKDGNMEFVEVQGTGEQTTFSRSELDKLLALAESGICDLMNGQLEALGERSAVIYKKPRLVLASNNFNKLRELRALLGDSYDIISMREAGFDEEIDENGETFTENAVIKAKAVSDFCKCAALADDSGLSVVALNGRPGVHSARYSGVHGDDDANNKLLIKELDGIEDRRASYECAIALCRPNMENIIAEGRCTGVITKEAIGDGGFGYDPYFLSDDLGVTFAVADMDTKNKVSHRARALKALKELLK